MKVYNLHIVRSPLQLINILEAIETMSLANNILLIIDRKSEENTKQIQEVLKCVDYEFSNIYHIKKQSKSNLFEYVKLIKNIKKLKFDNIFTGDIDSISNVIFANLMYDKIFLVDDGTSTLKRHDEFINQKSLSFKDKAKLFRFNLFGLKSYKSYKINFFSFFDLKQKKGEIIVKNEFKNLKKRFHLSDNFSDKVYILGQPLYNKEISEDAFLEHLKKILDYYKDKELIYLKHRYENPTEKISKLLDGRAKIIQNEYPIELDFLIKQEYPRYITGFFSTAIYTLSRMFNNAETDAFYIEKEYFFNEERADVVDNYYDFFVKSNINIIK